MTYSNPTLDIDLAAICANYRRLADANPDAVAAGVVKCDAYGLGAEAVGRALFLRENCREFFVAYSEEGAALRQAIGPEAEIFIFNGPFEDFLPAYREHNLTPVINSTEQAALWIREMRGAPVALHVDSGMHRLGLPAADIVATDIVGKLNVSLIMSHLACASEPGEPMNETQRNRFQEIAAHFPNARPSLSSSGGALISERFGFGLVRLGVGVYGVSPHDDGVEGFRPVAELTAPVIQIHELAPGETVGYGATFQSKGRRRLATVALGYGDGFPRAASNRGSAYLGGALCPIAGRVSMDLIVLDVTDADEALKTGDRAEFFGRNHPIDRAAEACGTIGYELLTGIGGLARPRIGLGGRVRRRYLWNGAPAPNDLVGAEG